MKYLDIIAKSLHPMCYIATIIFKIGFAYQQVSAKILECIYRDQEKKCVQKFCLSYLSAKGEGEGI